MIRALLRRLKSRFLPSTEDEILRIAPELFQLDAYSMVGLRALENLYILGRHVVRRNIAGDFVECGVRDGGSAAAIACALRDTERRIWLYDSFQGLPTPKEVDGPWAEELTGACVGSAQKVIEAMRTARFPEAQCIVRKGWFDETMRGPLPQAVSILHIDADWHDSVMLSLNTFYDLVAEGGVIILDDFGQWEGCRHAFYDFVGQRNLRPLLERYGFSQAFWIKGRESNREFCGEVSPPLERISREIVRNTSK